MNPKPATDANVEAAWKVLAWILAMISAAGVLAVATVAWLDTRTEPNITITVSGRTEIAVEVRGAVSTPGVVFIEPGDRMIDVVNESGGFTDDADKPLVNLSTRVMDGQVIVIPTIVPASGSATNQSTGLLNINTASIDKSKSLPGIGDVLAQRIVAYREFNGPFQNVDELTNVEGVSPTLVDNIRQYITVTDGD